MSILDLKLNDFRKKYDFRKKMSIFLETIPGCLNFAEFYRFPFYPKKLSYSSSNAYIKKIGMRELGKPTCLLKNLKSAQ